jgi:uncharacterized Zn finger protein
MMLSPDISLEANMKCDRCEGLMLEDDFLDMQETGGMWLRMWRCINCGHALDAVMVANRQRHALLMSSQGVLEESAPKTDRNVIVGMAA